jgi:hypothetical protein
VFEMEKEGLMEIVTDSTLDEMGEAYKNTLYAYETQKVLCRHPNKEYVRGDKRIKEPVLRILPSEEGKRKIDG